LEASDNSVEIILHFKRLPEHNLPCRATVIERDARDFVYLQYRLWRELYDTLPGNSQFPDEVDVQFLPIGVRTGNVATLGVIIARGRRDGSADWSRKWYKCGMYVSRSFDTEESMRLSWERLLAIVLLGNRILSHRTEQITGTSESTGL
jgi:hypothetical protein